MHSAVLAQTGATGPRRIVEGADGVIELFGGGQGDPGALTEKLGEKFHVTRIGMKPYPSCRVSHPHISAALEARERLGHFEASDVESVEVWATPIGHSMIGQPFQIRENPQVDAQFSAQWTTAFSLLKGVPRIAHFDPDAIVSGAEVIELAQKTRVHIWEEESLLLVPVRIRVKLKDGREADVTHDKIKGSPEWAMSEKERKEKFFSCAEAAARRLEPELLERAFEELSALEDCADIRPILAGLTPAKNPALA